MDEFYDRELYLMHYGTKRHSGRYPWGSGEDPYQHESSFLSSLKVYKDEGMSETDIAKVMGMSTTELRERVTVEKNAKEAYDKSYIRKLKDKGYSNVAIAKKMGVSEGTVRNYIKEGEAFKKSKLDTAADVLRKNVDEKGYIDVGKGVNLDLNTTETNMKAAIKKLTNNEGYKLYYLKVEQLGTGHYTDMKILCPPGTEYKDLLANKDKIKTITDYISDDGKTVLGLKPPKSIDAKRVKVRYAEEGGADMDGVIQLRRNVEDLSLGNANYAQVRIAVNGTHYLKGMAMYCDDMPKGVDVIFNTNKHVGTPMLGEKDNTVLKPLKKDPDNPFGATIKPQGQHGAINVVNEEGDWNKWSKSLASQMLSKQPTQLAKRQLDLAYAEKKEEFDTIMSLTNPAIKEELLIKFANSCDKAAVTLKAAALPRQASKVILPITDLKDNEIYAPTFDDGEEVILIRYPHGGTFEIPRLKVNNNNASAKKVIFNATDAVGINANVAARLSGADFDGDTVLVIPTKNIKVESRKQLEGLKNFDPKELYPKYPGMKIMGEQDKQKKMGEVSNLITDMTLKGASEDEIARAVRHSMVVIDAVKHELNYKQSYIDNGIEELRKLYQDGGGASTLISRAKRQYRVPKRKSLYSIDPETGKKIYMETGETDRNGKVILEKSTEMAETDDAYILSSGTRMENIYANYANQMKSLGNQARKESVGISHYKVNPSAKETYSQEVISLKAKLNDAIRNSPKERQAQLYANQVVAMKKAANPDIDKDGEKKIKNQALAAARVRFGANKKDVEVQITDKEWEAIQAFAVPYTTLKSIINNTDLDKFKERAMPREKLHSLSDSKKSLALSMHNSGYTLKEIADRLGVSTSTVSGIIHPDSE